MALAGNRLVLESLGLVKDPDNGPVKPKRVFSKKVYERNPERVLRPQVIRMISRRSVRWCGSIS